MKLKIGRLQDVDIAPDYQRMGLGNQLLESIVAVAKRLRLTGWRYLRERIVGLKIGIKDFDL